MPFVLINWIVGNSLRRAEGQSAIRAAREHDVAPVAGAELLHRGKHVDIVVRSRAGTVYCQEDHSRQSPWIDRCTKQHAAAEVDRNVLIKSWRDGRVLRVAGPNTKKRAPKISPADEEIAISVHIECSPHMLIGDINWIHPRDSAVSRSTELPEAARGSGAPDLVLEAVTHAAGCLIDREPLLVTSSRVPVGLKTRPGLAEIWRAVHVVAER